MQIGVASSPMGTLHIRAKQVRLHGKIFVLWLMDLCQPYTWFALSDTVEKEIVLQKYKADNVDKIILSSI
jgi:hypothetical protein